MKKEKEKKPYVGRVPTVKGSQEHRNKKRQKKSDPTGRKAKYKNSDN